MPVPDPSAISADTRYQVAGMAQFQGGEGIWFDSGLVYFTTKQDNKIHSYDIGARRMGVVYARAATAGAPLSGLDNITVSRSGDLFVCEDGGDMDIGLLVPDFPGNPNRWTVSRFLKLTGSAHSGSELAGGVFDRSGTRMYFSSQRGFGYGAMFEVTGPFPEPRPDSEVVALGGAPVAGSSPDADAGGPVVAPAGLRLWAPSRMLLGPLLRRGLGVTTWDERGGKLEVVLRTFELGSVPGERGSTDRPVPVTLAAGAPISPPADRRG